MNGNDHPSRFLYNFQESPVRVRIYVLLRLCTIARGETERGSMYVQIHSRSPKLSIFAPDGDEIAPPPWDDDLKIVCER